MYGSISACSGQTPCSFVWVNYCLQWVKLHIALYGSIIARISAFVISTFPGHSTSSVAFVVFVVVVVDDVGGGGGGGVC